MMTVLQNGTKKAIDMLTDTFFIMLLVYIAGSLFVIGLAVISVFLNVALTGCSISEAAYGMTQWLQSNVIPEWLAGR